MVVILHALKNKHDRELIINPSKLYLCQIHTHTLTHIHSSKHSNESFSNFLISFQFCPWLILCRLSWSWNREPLPDPETEIKGPLLLAFTLPCSVLFFTFLFVGGGEGVCSKYLWKDLSSATLASNAIQPKAWPPTFPQRTDGEKWLNKGLVSHNSTIHLTTTHGFTCHQYCCPHFLPLIILCYFKQTKQIACFQFWYFSELQKKVFPFHRLSFRVVSSYQLLQVSSYQYAMNHVFSKFKWLQVSQIAAVGKSVWFFSYDQNNEVGLNVPITECSRLEIALVGTSVPPP